MESTISQAIRIVEQAVAETTANPRSCACYGTIELDLKLPTREAADLACDVWYMAGKQETWLDQELKTLELLRGADVMAQVTAWRADRRRREQEHAIRGQEIRRKAEVDAARVRFNRAEGMVDRDRPLNRQELLAIATGLGLNDDIRARCEWHASKLK